jgi:very-short-patch-repair endonuclease/predicted transcriptional regulator of viral defense system
LTDAEPDVRAVVTRLSGVATRSELAAAGLPEAELRRQLRRGALVPVGRGAYTLSELAAAATGDPAREHALAAAAAVRRAGAGAAASHHSAAVIHRLDLLSRPDSGTVALTRSPHGSRSRSDRAGAVVHIADLPPEQVTCRLGVQVTTVARTVIDLARTLPFADGVVVADAALQAKKAARAELDSVLAACARWPGVRRAERVAAFSDHRAESALESAARVVFYEHGLPAPKLQAWVGDAEQMIGRADFFWPEHQTVAEADGAVKYATPERAVRQLGRDALLRAGGFEVVHFTWREIMTVPWQVVASIRAAFTRADAASGRA